MTALSPPVPVSWARIYFFDFVIDNPLCSLFPPSPPCLTAASLPALTQATRLAWGSNLADHDLADRQVRQAARSDRNPGERQGQRLDLRPPSRWEGGD